MKISVIIPTLNAERWISRQFDSLLPQTTDAGKIVINSGLTDAACFRVRAHADCIRFTGSRVEKRMGKRSGI